MNIFRFAVALIAALSAPAVLAQLDDHNENASMSIVGAETIRVAPGATVPERFSVRIVDAQGVPMEGLAVWFFPDGCGESGGPDFFYCPPWAVYGTFDPPVNPDVIGTVVEGSTCWIWKYVAMPSPLPSRAFSAFSGYHAPAATL